jgi:hypothetical protein
MAGNGIFDRDLIQAFSSDAVVSLTATTENATADFDAVVANPVVLALAPTTDPAAANFDLVLEIPVALAAATGDAQANLDVQVANPVEIAIDAETEDAQANLDLVLEIELALEAVADDAVADFDVLVNSTAELALEAVTEDAVADFAVEVANPVVLELEAQTEDAVADFDLVSGEQAQQPGGGGFSGGWRQKAIKQPEKPRRKRVRHTKIEIVAVGQSATVVIRGTVEVRGRVQATGAGALVHLDGRVKESRRARAIARELRTVETEVTSELALERRERRLAVEVEQAELVAVAADDTNDIEDFGEILLTH